MIWGDDIGTTNLSAYSRGVMGYRTPNIDSIANEGAIFTDHYAQPSCTAGRASFITGQYPIRTGLTTVSFVGSPLGMQAKDVTLAEVLEDRWLRRRPNSARTTSAIATSTCRPCTASTSSSATSTT